MTVYKSFIGGADINFWDGVSRTFTRKTSTGGSLTLNRVGVLCNILDVYGSGTAYTDTTISKAFSRIGSGNVGLLLVPGTWTISNDLTIPANTPLYLMPGAVISVASSKTLTVNSQPEAGPYQIFAGNGSFTFAQGLHLKTSWFASFSTAITKIGTAAVTLEVTKSETISADTTVNANTTLLWLAWNNLSITSGKTLTINGYIVAGPHGIIGGTGILAGTPTALKNSNWIQGVVVDTATWGGTFSTDTLKADTMTENTADNGIDIEGINHKDGIIANHAPFRGETNGLSVKRFGNTQVKISPAAGATGEIIFHDSAGTPLKKSFTQQTCTITNSGAGGLDTGAEASETYYYIWLIYNPTSSTVSSLLSTSSTSPTMPSGYTYKALVGLVYNDASSNFEEVGTYRVPFGKYLDFDYAHEPVSINSGSSYTFNFDFSATPGSLSTRAVLITVRGSDSNNLSWKAWDRTSFYQGYQSGGQGAAPAAPADPGANKINVIVQNNYGFTQTVYCRATVIGVR